MKIRVTTKDHEYQGLYAGSEHDVEDTVYIGGMEKLLYSFKVNGKLWKLYEDECELIDEQGRRISYAQAAKEGVTKDMVNSPSHYALFDDIEAIQVIAASMTKEMFKGYCFGNLLKYKLRAGGKDDIQQELKKADKYKELYEKYQNLCKQN